MAAHIYYNGFDVVRVDEHGIVVPMPGETVTITDLSGGGFGGSTSTDTEGKVDQADATDTLGATGDDVILEFSVSPYPGTIRRKLVSGSVGDAALDPYNCNVTLVAEDLTTSDIPANLNEVWVHNETYPDLPDQFVGLAATDAVTALDWAAPNAGVYTVYTNPVLENGERRHLRHEDGPSAPFTAAASGFGVESVSLTMPSIFSVSGSPGTANASLGVSLVAQAANKVFAGPTSGGSAAPTFRSLVPADIPTLALSIGQSVTGGGAKRVLYEDNSQLLAASANLQFDGSNLGIGVTPTKRLHVKGATAGTTAVTFLVENSSAAQPFTVQDDGNVNIGASSNPANNSRLYVFGGTNGANVDVRGAAGATTDQAIIELEGNDYDTSVKSSFLMFRGSTFSGSYLGFTSANLGMLMFGGDTSVIATASTKLIFAMNGAQRASIETDGTFLTNGTLGQTAARISKAWLTNLEITNMPTVGGTSLSSVAQVFTNKDLTSGTNTFPTFNQNTTGSAAKWTTARTLAGNSVDGSANVAFANKFIVQGTTDAGLSAAQFLGALGTGIVKNTTTTGVLSIAVAADFPTLNQNTTGSAATLTTPRAIYGNNFDGSAALAQIIASTYGGTGNGFTKFSGPATSEKTFTLPNASATILTDNAVVTLNQGGTNATAANFATTNGQVYFDGTRLVNNANVTWTTPYLQVAGLTNAGFAAFASNSTSAQYVLGNAALTKHWAMYETLGASGQQGSFKILDYVAVADVWAIDTTGSITNKDGGNYVLGTTTGTKWGTATNQKQAFWNATPIVQPTTGGAAATFVANTGTAVNDASTFDGYTMKQVVKALRNLGLLA
jgi:hypothetical protein